MENIENSQQIESSVIISEDIKKFLLETSKWAKFLAIIGFIGMGFLILGALIVMIAMPSFGNSPMGNFPMRFLGLIYVLIAVIYYFPVSYLYKFSVTIKSGLLSNDSNAVTYGFENLKSHYKFMGIFVIVILSIYALMIPIMIFTAL